MRKGILLAGGTGSRLFPVTRTVNKHLLPVFDKPMIYYSLSVLMLAGVRDILIITTPGDISQFQRLFGDGSRLGLMIAYEKQDAPRGIAEAFLIGERFIAADSVALMLGDNLLFGAGLSARLQSARDSEEAVVFSYKVKDPNRYGVIEVNSAGRGISIEEKPASPKSDLAVMGLYFYPNDVIEKARQLQPSGRNELEITDINRAYMNQNRLRVEHLGRGYAWLDAGTEAALLEASNFVSAIQTRQNLKIGCIEEIAWRMGWLSVDDLLREANSMSGSAYGAYVASVADGAS